MATKSYYAANASGWDSSSPATGVPDGSYAQEAQYSGTISMITSNFGIDDIPANATIQSVTVNSKVRRSNTSQTVGIVARISGADQGTVVNATAAGETTITKVYTSGDLLNAANLVNGTFDVRVRGVLAQGIVYCDYVEVIVSYMVPSVGLEMGCVF